MSYNSRVESIKTALEYLDEARRLLAGPAARDHVDLLIRQATDRIREALDVKPSDEAISEVRAALREAV